MANLGLLPKFDINETHKCEICVESKFARKPFKSIERSSELLELVHSDLCDLKMTPTRGGIKYFITFIDDYSRYCYVNFSEPNIKHKRSFLHSSIIGLTQLETNVTCSRLKTNATITMARKLDCNTYNIMCSTHDSSRQQHSPSLCFGTSSTNSIILGGILPMVQSIHLLD